MREVCHAYNVVENSILSSNRIKTLEDELKRRRWFLAKKNMENKIGLSRATLKLALGVSFRQPLKMKFVNSNPQPQHFF